MSTAPQWLSNVPPFSLLPDAMRAELAKFCTLRTFKAQSRIVDSHTMPTSLLAVVSGQLQLLDETEDGRVSILGYLGPGAMAGWLSAIDEQPGPCAVVAASEAQVLTIPMATARALLSTTAVNQFVMKLLASAARQQIEERRTLCTPNAFQRVFLQILCLTKQGKEQDNLTILPRQQEIAIMVNTSRETVSRAFQILIRRGILTKVGHRMIVADSAKLASLAHDGPSSLNNESGKAPPEANEE